MKLVMIVGSDRIPDEFIVVAWQCDRVPDDLIDPSIVQY